MDDKYIKLTQEWHRKGYESRQAEIDELQKRIDEALILCEKGCVLKAMSVLKGNNQ